MTVDFDAFKILINTNPHYRIVEDYVFDGIPYVFKDNPVYYDTLKLDIESNLKSPGMEIVISGSASTGFSMSPYKFGNVFSPSSDIDVVVIDSNLFDEAWYSVLDWAYPRRLPGVPQAEREWYAKRHKEVFWGWMHPAKMRYRGVWRPQELQRINMLSNNWFDAFQRLSRRPELSSRKISGRLYRTREHALRYHADGLRQIVNTLQKTP